MFLSKIVYCKSKNILETFIFPEAMQDDFVQMLYLFFRITSTAKETKTILTMCGFKNLRLINTTTIYSTIYKHSTYIDTHPHISPGNTWTQSLVTNFLSFNLCKDHSSHHKQDFLDTTSNISHCLLKPQIINS